MEHKSSEQIRQLFLEFFASKGHAIEPSAPLVPVNDNTLLWINSGVAALKKYFDGSVKAKNPRIVNVQKSLRTNDIENVGMTARHQTFFEMMGNFSIGDYFKKEAIAFAYEFLFSPDWIGLDVDKAYITVHSDDEEAYRYWIEDQRIPASRILKTPHNFWQIGDGPCGPNSEIFYDRGETYDPNGIGEKLFFDDIENDRYVEVWNIVFSQYNGVEGQDPKTFEELPQKNIDTGMGFERLVSIVQEVPSNFDTDLFTPIIKKIESYADGNYNSNKRAYCVIADHIRAITFALSDGALFANEGRGYVLRRLLRRAVRYGKVLGIEGLFLKDLVKTVIEKMSLPYPDLLSHKDKIAELVEAEEKRFAKTLHAGEALLLNELADLSGTDFSGDLAFKLYDTYGFPIELTQEIVEEHGLRVDMEGFNQALEEQKQRARQGREKTESMQQQNEDLLHFSDESVFLYDSDACEAVVIALFKAGRRVDKLEGKGLAVFNQTPFYAESGGQVSDTGWLNDTVMITAVSKANHGQHLHELEVDLLELGDEVSLRIDQKRRLAIRKNHSAVHLLQAALQRVLGDHVKQAGSYVDDEYLRFDFNHFSRVSEEELEQVSDLVNGWIQDTLPIKTEIMSLEAARKSGAMALFSENYSDVVRVVSMGISKELCGGTHARNTSELGLFIIDSEESVGSGIRRISAKTGRGAYQEYRHLAIEHDEIREALKLAKQKTILERLAEIKEEREVLLAKYTGLKQASLRIETEKLLVSTQETATGLRFVYAQFKDRDSDELKELVDRLSKKIDIVFVVNIKEEAIAFVAACSDKAIGLNIKAGDLAKQAALLSGGNGGGRPQFAQAGGKNITKLSEVKHDLENKLDLLLPIQGEIR